MELVARTVVLTPFLYFSTHDVNAQREHRWLRASLRMYFALLTIGCVCLGWTVNRVTGQRKVVQWVIAVGGTVEYDFQLDADGQPVEDAKLPGPEWLRERLGVDYFATVRHVSLSKSRLDETLPAKGMRKKLWPFNRSQESALAPLANLTHLESLRLNNTKVRDLSPLKGLTTLNRLHLSSSQVTDLSPLKGLTGLQVLNLKHTQVSDLSPLKGLTKLQQLYLEDTPVRDLSSLEGLAQLAILDLKGTQVTDLSPLKGCSKLIALFLQRTQVTDLSPLVELPRLQYLHLKDRPITHDVIKFDYNACLQN